MLFATKVGNLLLVLDIIYKTAVESVQYIVNIASQSSNYISFDHSIDFRNQSRCG